MSILLRNICNLILIALICSGFKIHQISAEHIQDDLNVKDGSINKDEMDLNAKAELIVKKASYLIKDLAELTENLIENANRSSISTTEGEQFDTCYCQLADHENNEPNSKHNAKISRLYGFLFALKPVFLILGIMSAIRKIGYIFKKFEDEIVPNWKKVWENIIQEIRFITPFDYMIDFCPTEHTND